MKEIAFTAVATRQWLRFSSDVRARLDGKLTEFARSGKGDVKRLKGREETRLRVGDWRIVFYLDGNTVVVAAVGHRREIYD
jgi:mRNA interferase RelE/StbE